MPLQATSGAASYDAFGGGVAAVPNYIEDVFQTWLYTGNSSTQTITNGIDLAGKGGLTWIKVRDFTYNHYLYDTARGVSDALFSNSTSAQSSSSNFSSFDSSGFTLNSSGGLNNSSYTYASWTFRKQPKFFDVVTWTGNDATSRTLSHSINGTVGCVMVKKTSSAGNWIVWHRTFPTAGDYIILNSTAAKQNDVDNGISTTNTTFTVGFGLNVSGENYVAYIFAHDAGSFGLTGTDNVITCGSYTGNGSTSGPSVTLGYEPQWLLVKNATSVRNWFLVDNMRGLTVGGVDPILQPNSSSAEQSSSSYNYFSPTATGFAVTNSDGDVNANGDTYIYIAIRRGPMKVPTSGTSVLDVETYTGTQAARTITTANTVDLSFTKSRSTAGTRWNWTDRLRGATKTLDSSLTAAEASDTTGYTSFAVQQGYTLGTGDTYDVNTSGRTYVSWNLTRSPSFFDEVCYTGVGGQTLNHNLSVTPELIISKRRSGVYDWTVYSSARGTSNTLFLNLTNAETAYTTVSAATATTFTVQGVADASGETLVAYLFATCAGVSKVGSYTGTGTTKQVDCGFTGGARFVLIKRTDSTGDWYVWDSARGIVAGNDSYLLLNSTAAEVTNTDYIDTYSAGFEISSTAPAAINASGGSFIFFAVA